MIFVWSWYHGDAGLVKLAEKCSLFFFKKFLIDFGGEEAAGERTLRRLHAQALEPDTTLRS